MSKATAIKLEREQQALPNAEEVKPQILAMSTFQLSSGQQCDVSTWADGRCGLYLRGLQAISICVPLSEQDAETLVAELTRTLSKAREERKARDLARLIAEAL